MTRFQLERRVANLSWECVEACDNKQGLAELHASAMRLPDRFARITRWEIIFERTREDAPSFVNACDDGTPCPDLKYCQRLGKSSGVFCKRELDALRKIPCEWISCESDYRFEGDYTDA